MNWLLNNWSLLVVILAVVFIGVHYAKKFTELPSEEQLLKVREFLIWAVIEAERTYKSQMGVVKLRFVYSEFCKYFPSLVPLVPFDVFSKMVDSALEQMRHLLETNPAINAYVDLDNKEAE